MPLCCLFTLIDITPLYADAYFFLSFYALFLFADYYIHGMSCPAAIYCFTPHADAAD